MNKGDIFIAGEDFVTIEILRRIVGDYAHSLHIISSLPARGSELKTKISYFNKVAQTIPIVLLSDLDTDDCAPLAKKKLLIGVNNVADDFVVNIAVDEAEAWLYADKVGFSKYLKVNLDKFPIAKESTFGGSKKRIEVDTPCKTSYHLTHILMKESSDAVKKKQILVEGFGSCKGKEYNSAILPFIRNVWNIESARKNSYSLNGMIQRVQELEKRIFL